MSLVDRDIHGLGSAPPAAIRRSLTERGRNLASHYAPDRQYHEPPADIEQVIIEEARRYPGHEVDADGLTAQINLETAGLQSAFWLERNNPGGIGAVDTNPGQAARFDTPRAGLRAMVAHLLTYRFGAGPWTADDPRAAYTPAGWQGTTTRWRDLQGRWATSPTYAATLEGIWARLEAISAEVLAGQGAQLPGFLWQPARDDHFERGRTTRIRGGAQHYTAGVNSLDWLTHTSGADDPSRRVSAHVLVRRGATLEERGWQLVRLEDTAWTTAFANPYTVAIEYEHLASQDIPDGDYEVLAQTWADITRYVRAHGLGDIEVIAGHKQWVNNPQLACPDGIDVGRITRRVRELLADETPLLADRNPLGPFGLVRGFRARLETIGRAVAPDDVVAGILTVVGWPQELEWGGEDGCSYQRCERAVLQWTPNTAPPWDIVLMHRDAGPLPRRRDA